jgi:hypothetical protein
VWDGETWHLFGTGAFEDLYGHETLHATASALHGPWTLQPPAVLCEVAGTCVAAPGVVADGAALHMFVQTEYNFFGGRVEHLVSDDGGSTFVRTDTALRSDPHVGEAGLYDPHPAEIAGERYLVYSAFNVIGCPDIYLARSESGCWDGPWERLGAILRHQDVACHNQIGDPAYEWGLEGAQLLELSGGQVVLNAVCFLAGAPVGSRQRVFFAVADAATGPYDVIGPVLGLPDGAEHAENGHASVVVHDGALHLFFQERTGQGPWSFAHACAQVEEIA